MDRRQFLASSGALIPAQGGASSVVGRPVRAVSIGFRPGPSLEQIAALVDKEAGRGADLIALPETFD